MSRRRNHLLFLVLTMLALHASAQFVPVTQTIQTPYGNVNQTYYIGAPRIYYYNGNASVKHNFIVELLNDSVFTTHTWIRSGDDHKDFLKVKINKENKIIKPVDTKSIWRKASGGRKLVGIPADSCWLFKVATGKINLYSFLAEEDIKAVVAMQVGDGAIVKISKETLLPIIGNITTLRKLVEKGEFVRAIERYNDDYYKDE
jgi:hypothetical protein